MQIYRNDRMRQFLGCWHWQSSKVKWYFRFGQTWWQIHLWNNVMYVVERLEHEQNTQSNAIKYQKPRSCLNVAQPPVRRCGLQPARRGRPRLCRGNTVLWSVQTVNTDIWLVVEVISGGQRLAETLVFSLANVGALVWARQTCKPCLTMFGIESTI